MKKTLKLNRRALLALKESKKWDEEKTYDSLYRVPSGKKHDSGYMQIVVVGLLDHKPIEQAARPDDINWIIPPEAKEALRMDCEYPSGIIHVWSRRFGFKVGDALSSTDIELVPRGI